MSDTTFEYRVVDTAGETRRFSISAEELQESHRAFCSFAAGTFLARIGEILHYVCIVAWLREMEQDELLADTGLVHELIHVLNGGELTPVIRQAVAALAPPSAEEIRETLLWKNLPFEVTGG